MRRITDFRIGREINDCAPLVGPQMGRDLPGGQITRSSVQPSIEKYFASRMGRNSNRANMSHPKRGAARDRHEREGGMRWTRAASGARKRVGPMTLKRTAKSCGAGAADLKFLQRLR